MNRRQFFGAMIAPVGAVIGAKIPSLGSNIPEVGFHGDKKYLYVVPTQKQAWALYNKMWRPKNVKVISAGSMICGYGADLIIMDENWDEDFDSGVRREFLDAWYNETIRTRLYPGGRIITRKLT